MTFISNGPGEMALGTADRLAAIAEVKRLLAVSIADDDALIGAFAETALGLAERFIGRVLIVRAITERVAADGAWQPLGAAPVMAITSVAAVDGDTVTPLAVDAYGIDLDADARGWVRAPSSASRLIEIVYQAGWIGTWGLIPAPVRQGAVSLAAHLYTQRDASEPPPAAITALWRPYRDQALARAVKR